MTSPLPLPEMPQSIIPLRPQRSRSNDVILSGIVGLLLFGPLAFGAVEPWAVFVAESVAAVLVLLWGFQQVRSGQASVIGNAVFTPMCAFVALLGLQWLTGISAYRHATYSSLLLYIAYGSICFLLAQTLGRTTHIRRLATLLVIYGTGMAMFAVLQSLSSNGKLYWLRTPRFGGWIYGPYVNHNHYAGLMEMIAPIPLVFAFTRYAHGRMRWLAAAAAAFMGATIFLSGSRGGMAAFAVQMALFVWLLFRERTRNRVALLLGGFLLIAIALVTWIGGSEVSDRISTLTPGNHAHITTDLRLAIDRDGLRMFAHRPWLGWGMGTFAEVFPQFRSFYTNSFVNAAHNDYLQVLTETGAIGFALMIWFLITAIRPAWRKTKNWPSDVNGAVALAAVLGIVGILVHSFTDFNLQVPANALLFYVLCTVAAMEPRFRNFRREHKHSSVTEEMPSQAI